MNGHNEASPSIIVLAFLFCFCDAELFLRIRPLIEEEPIAQGGSLQCRFWPEHDAGKNKLA